MSAQPTRLNPGDTVLLCVDGRITCRYIVGKRGRLMRVTKTGKAWRQTRKGKP